MISNKKDKLLLCLLFIIQYSLFNTKLVAQDYTLTAKDTSEVRFLNQRKFFIYKVDKGETLYSISKKFKIPQEEINEFNADLKDGLKPRMKLWIPAWSHLKVEPKVEVKPEKAFAEETYQVSVFTAFHIPKNFSVDTSLVDSSYVGESLDAATVSNLEFYEGILKAVDSLENLKFKIHLNVYDTEDDSLTTALLLMKQDVKKSDLVISNGNTVVTRLINRFSRSHNVKFVSCSLNSSDIINDNYNAIGMIPSSMAQCREAGKITSEKFKNFNCIVLKTAAGKENERSAAFKKGWLENPEAKLKEINFVKSGKDSMSVFIKTIKDSLSAKTDNLIFVPSSNEDFVSALVNSLKAYSDTYRITLVGLPTWQYFETIDPILFELLDTHIFTSSYISHNSPSVVRFRKSFYNTYSIEPVENAFLGFDVMMIAGSELMQQGKKFKEDMTGKSFKGLYTTYRFDGTENTFIENRFVSVCKYRNYELKRINE